jgi:hypothetical protein
MPKFIGPQIRSLHNGKDFQNSINVERNAWTAVKNVIEKVMEITKEESCLKNFHILGLFRSRFIWALSLLKIVFRNGSRVCMNLR